MVDFPDVMFDIETDTNVRRALAGIVAVRRVSNWNSALQIELISLIIQRRVLMSLP